MTVSEDCSERHRWVESQKRRTKIDGPYGRRVYRRTARGNKGNLETIYSGRGTPGGQVEPNFVIGRGEGIRPTP